jgi:hypothetical protein
VLGGRREEGMELRSRLGRWAISRRQCRIRTDVKRKEISRFLARRKVLYSLRRCEMRLK